MKPERINQLIAEFCGWEDYESWVLSGRIRTMFYWRNKHSGERATYLPNYHGDLNAVHEAEKKFDALDYQYKNKYTTLLEQILEKELLKDDPNCLPDVWPYEMIHATAPQRCEALLKTIGKWEE